MKSDGKRGGSTRVMFQSFFLWKLVMKLSAPNTNDRSIFVSILLPLETGHEVSSKLGEQSKTKVSILLPLETGHEVTGRMMLTLDRMRFNPSSFGNWS